MRLPRLRRLLRGDGGNGMNPLIGLVRRERAEIAEMESRRLSTLDKYRLDLKRARLDGMWTAALVTLDTADLVALLEDLRKGRTDA
jgi:hypothetical protein